jgi:hypothetical protein
VSVVYRCDGCEELIEPDVFRFDVNVYEPAQQIEPTTFDSDEPIMLTAIADFTSNAQHHFCTPSCLGAWAMNRALDPT